VVPSWWTEPVSGDRAVLRLDPGAAFGTGTHVTTALAWELLEESLPARRLLDVGAGSGILSLGALLMTPSLRAVATEADPGAARALAGNVDRAGVRDRCHPVRARGVPCPGGTFDLAVANLTLAEHEAVAGALAGAMAPTCRVVVSGLRAEDATPNIFKTKGFQCSRRMDRKGWRAERWARP
jgi:ribosomal protein L11 methyltransferase